VSGLPGIVRPRGLQFHAEAVGHPVHVVEIRSDLIRIHNRTVIEAGMSQSINIALGHHPRLQRQLDGIATERRHAGVQVV
jgi:hypothetical protein